MMKNITKILFVLLISLSLVGCATSGNGKKEGIGTVIGAVGGAIGGALIGGKRHAGVGAIIGGLLGAFIGNRIGNALDERDRQALETKIRETIETAKVCETAIWHSDHTNASGVIEVTEETSEIQQVNVDKVPDVILPTSAQLTAAGGVRWVSTALNVRKGPGQTYDKIKTLPKNTEVSLNGFTDDHWYLISENNVVIGYVSGKYLKTKRPPVIDNELPVVDPVSPGEIGLANNKSSVEDTAIIKVKCKTVKVNLRVNGKITEDSVKTCQDPNGSWGA